MKNGRESEIILLTAYDGQNDNGLVWHKYAVHG